MKFLSENLFDAIYFLDADRIAHEVTIQTIIIEEILKHRKQLVINGKDYVKNPENKFTLMRDRRATWHRVISAHRMRRARA